MSIEQLCNADLLDQPQEPGNGSALSQYILLSKSVTGEAAVELIEQALDAPGVYMFSELLDMPNIADLASGPHAKYLRILMLFAYGTLSEYRADEPSLPGLSDVQLTKLRHLTIVSLAMNKRCLPYDVLLIELDINNVRELEDSIIDCIYSGIIRGKLDQKHCQLQVHYTIARDVPPRQIPQITGLLEEWRSTCEDVLRNMDALIKRTDERKAFERSVNVQIEQQVNDIRKYLKLAKRRYGDDDEMATESMAAVRDTLSVNSANSMRP